MPCIDSLPAARTFTAHSRKAFLRCTRGRGIAVGSARASSSEPAARDAASPPAPESSSVSCIGTSMEVPSSVSDDPQDPRSMPLAKAEASVSGFAAETQMEGIAESLGAKTLAVLLLVSPFFFWGTSMVGMKVWCCVHDVMSM